MARHALMARSALIERPIMGCDTPSAPRAPRAGGRWRGVNAVCGGKRHAPRDPRPPTPPPLSVPGAPSEGGGTLHAPLRVPFQIQGVQGQKKIREMEKLGEVRQGPGSRGRTDGESAGMDHSTYPDAPWAGCERRHQGAPVNYSSAAQRCSYSSFVLVEKLYVNQVTRMLRSATRISC